MNKHLKKKIYKQFRFFKVSINIHLKPYDECHYFSLKVKEIKGRIAGQFLRFQITPIPPFIQEFESTSEITKEDLIYWWKKVQFTKIKTLCKIYNFVSRCENIRQKVLDNILPFKIGKWLFIIAGRILQKFICQLEFDLKDPKIHLRFVNRSDLTHLKNCWKCSDSLITRNTSRLSRDRYTPPIENELEITIRLVINKLLKEENYNETKTLYNLSLTSYFIDFL